MKRWLGRAVWAAVLIFSTVVVGGAIDARRRLSDLAPWHRYVPADATASDLSDTTTLADYLQREDAVFREVHDRIERSSAGPASPAANRYDPRSRSSPARLGSDWNRTHEIVPDGEITGGALLVHGLTDSPYSMRAAADTLEGARLLQPGAAHAGARHGARRADGGGLGGLAGGGPRRRPQRARQDRTRKATGAGRLLERRRARREIRARRRRARRSVAAGAHRADVADDRRRAVCVDGAGDQPARRRSRTSRRPAGSTSSRNTTRSSTTRSRPTPRCSRGGFRATVQAQILRLGKARPSQGAAADPGVPVAGGCHGEHRRGGARAVRSARRQRIRTRRLRHQPAVGHGAVHRSVVGLAACRGSPTHRRAATRGRSSPMRIAIPSTSSSARFAPMPPKSARGRSASPGRPTCSRSRTSRCRFRSTTRSTARDRAQSQPTSCTWARSAREANARC